MGSLDELLSMSGLICCAASIGHTEHQAIVQAPTEKMSHPSNIFRGIAMLGPHDFRLAPILVCVK